MDFSEQLRLLEAAQGDPRALALATLDIVLASHPPELRRVVEAAAIPHWFDETILTSMLDEDLKPESHRWFQAVTALSAVEPFPARSGFNVHESTRLAFRACLYRESKERFHELASRAVFAFSGSETHVLIERSYHLLIADPASGGMNLRLLNRQLSEFPEDSLALTRTIEEYADGSPWPPYASGWAYWLNAWNRAAYRTNDEETIAIAERALNCFKAARDEWAASLAMMQLGDCAITKGDLTTAQIYFEQAYAIHERIAASAPENTEMQYDLGISNERLGDIAQAQGQLNEATKRYLCWNEIIECLATRDVGNALWQRNLCVSYNKLGDLAVSRADLTDAKRYFEQSVTIFEHLAANEPSNEEWQRELSVSYNKLDDLAVSQGEVLTATNTFEQDLEIRELLSARSPNNVISQHNLLRTHSRPETAKPVTKILDAELVDLCQKGDPKAFEVLVDRYKGKIYSMIYNLIANDADAWDLSQEVFIKVWHALPKFEERASFYTWIYRIAHNVTYDAMRKKLIHSSVEFDDDMRNNISSESKTTPYEAIEPDKAEQQAEKIAQQEELGGRIRRALEQLSPEHRTALCLKDINGMRFHEIAKIMNCSQGAVMSRLFYARKKLQELLKDDYQNM